MSKLVILKLGEGDFEKGFPIILQIGDENTRPNTEIIGKLPPNPEITNDYFRWQSIYRHLRLPSRIKGLSKQAHQAPTLEECQQVTEDFKIRFNNWLASDSFRPIREKLLEKLASEDDIRILIQTKDLRSQKLPWHLWDLLERYPKAEIALSSPNYEKLEQLQITNEKVKILAILGNSEGIETQADRKILEQLPNADITFLVEPKPRDINNQLWEQNWQILFFAGHSITQVNETGKIYINQTESLTIAELKCALKTAVKRGLQLAIFNSCDGLGLAREFADLHIPEIIVMREPVPDQVAQEFLKYFLETFARGESLYLAVREARERLQGLENQFPCATWLPIIYQNPAEVPVYWQDLYNSYSNSNNVDASLTETTPKKPIINQHSLSLSTEVEVDNEIGDLSNNQTINNNNRKFNKKRGLINIALSSLMITSFVIVMRFIGLLQTTELQVFDQMMKMRPREGIDKRLLLITIDDNDIEAQRRRGEELKGVSISDKSLERLLNIVQKYQPSVIGLDVYRDFKTNPERQGLISRLKNTDNLVGICKVNSSGFDPYGVRPPEEFPSERLGFSDFVDDRDNVLRRQLLSMNPPPDSYCQSSYAFSLQLASRHLAKINHIQTKLTPDGQNWQIGNVILHKLKPRSGGYQEIDANSEQILLNYRAGNDIAQKLTLKQIFDAAENNPNALKKFIKNKIVLIGITRVGSEDRWQTPYGRLLKEQMSGVEAQAHMTSQILSAVLDKRPLITTLSSGNDTAWIWMWSVIGGSMTLLLFNSQASLKQFLPKIILALIISIIFLYSICFYLLIQGFWIAFFPSIIAFLGTSGINYFVILKDKKHQILS